MLSHGSVPDTSHKFAIAATEDDVNNVVLLQVAETNGDGSANKFLEKRATELHGIGVVGDESHQGLEHLTSGFEQQGALAHSDHLRLVPRILPEHADYGLISATERAVHERRL